MSKHEAEQRPGESLQDMYRRTRPAKSIDARELLKAYASLHIGRRSIPKTDVPYVEESERP